MNPSKLSNSELGNFDKYIEDLYSGKLLSENDIRLLCQKAKEILVEEPNIVQVQHKISNLFEYEYNINKQLFQTTGGELKNQQLMVNNESDGADLKLHQSRRIFWKAKMKCQYRHKEFKKNIYIK